MNDCLECDRPLRRVLTPAADAPGTRQFHGRGLCRPCYKALERDGSLDRLYPVRTNEDGRAIRRMIYDRNATTPCGECGKDMRPYGSKAEDWPGTVCRKGKLCAGCAQKRTTRRPSPSAAPDVQKMREDLKDWFYSRGRDWRLSGIPA